MVVSNQALGFPSHLSSSHLGLPNTILCQSPTVTATQRSCCHDPYRVLNVNSATTLETQSSPSASGSITGTTSPTIISLLSLETGESSEASESIPTPTSEPRYKASQNPGMKIGAGIGIGILILILIVLALAILIRRRQNHNHGLLTMDGLECEPKPSFEESSAKSPRDRPDVISSQVASWLGDGRNISPETHTLPLCGPRLTALNTTIPRIDGFKSSSDSKLVTNPISSPGLLGDAHAAFRFLDQSGPMAVPTTLANEARSPVSPEESPLRFFPSVPPSPEEILPPNTSQEHLSVDLDPPPLTTKNSHEFFSPIPQQGLKDATRPYASPSIIRDSPQSIPRAVRPSGVRAYSRDHPQPLRSNSSASRKTLADPPNHREANIANNPPGSDSTAGGPTITVKDSLDAKNDSAATIQNFSRKIGSIRSRQTREVDSPPPAVHDQPWQRV